MKLLVLTIIDASLDPRAGRTLSAAAARGVIGEAVSTGRPPEGVSERRRRINWATSTPRELRGAARVIRMARVTARLLRAAQGSRPDVVHAHDLDALPAGWLIARWTSARLVYDAHELYTAFDRDPPRAWLRIMAALEGALSRRAAAVVTVSRPIAETLHQRYQLQRRPTVILNCPPLETVTPSASSGPLRAIYQASAGPGRHLEDLIAVTGVEISARVLGATSAPPGVRLLKPVAPSELVRSLAPFDVGLVIDRPETENARLALPNKLFEYLMAGLAVAVPDAPAMAELVRREGVGVVYEPGRLGEALAALAANRPKLEEMKRRARAAAVERYNAEAQRPLLYEAWGI